jgi:tetratricopeptide (TPR) repeat protein
VRDLFLKIRHGVNAMIAVCVFTVFGAVGAELPPLAAISEGTASQQDLLRQFAQAQEAQRFAEMSTFKVQVEKEVGLLGGQVQKLSEQVVQAVNNSQKAADWWIAGAGMLLAALGIAVTIFGVAVPFFLTRKQRQDYSDQLKTIKAHEAEMTKMRSKLEELLAQAEQSLQRTHAAQRGAEDGLAHIKAVVASINAVDVEPGTEQARKVQSAMQDAAAKIELLPLHERLRLNALDAQARNDWHTALSLWQQRLQLMPNDGETALAFGNACLRDASQQSNPDIQFAGELQALKSFTQAVQHLSGARLGDALHSQGDAMWTLGYRNKDTQMLKGAEQAYRSALQERTRERVPMSWAAIQSNLGNVLSVLGQQQGDAGLLQQSVDAYRSALQERTRERVPMDWASTQNNLGSVLRDLARLSSDESLEQRRYLHEAKGCLEGALVAFTAGTDCVKEKNCRQALTQVQELIEQRQAHEGE